MTVLFAGLWTFSAPREYRGKDHLILRAPIADLPAIPLGRSVCVVEDDASPLNLNTIGQWSPDRAQDMRADAGKGIASVVVEGTLDEIVKVARAGLFGKRIRIEAAP